MSDLPTLTLESLETVLTLHTLPYPGTFSFDAAEYDAADDRLRLTAGPPTAAVGHLTPEGHVLRASAPDDRLVGLTIVDVARRLGRDGYVEVTLGPGQVATLLAADIAHLLTASAPRRTGRFSRGV